MPGLGLGDGAGRDNGQPGEIRLAQPAFLAHPAEACAEAAQGPFLLETRRAVGVGSKMEEPAFGGGPRFRLDHPEVGTAQLEHALRDPGDAVHECGPGGGPADTPVGEGTDVVELGADAAEQAQGPGSAQTPDEGVEAVDDNSPRSLAGVVEDPHLECGRVSQRPARPGIEDAQLVAELRAEPGRCLLRRDVGAGFAEAVPFEQE